MYSSSKCFEKICNALDSVKSYIHVLKMAQKYVNLNKKLLDSYSLAIPYLKINHNIPSTFFHLMSKYGNNVYFHMKNDSNSTDSQSLIKQVFEIVPYDCSDEAYDANFSNYYDYNSKTNRVFGLRHFKDVNEVDVNNFEKVIKKCLKLTISLYRPFFEYYRTPKASREKSIDKIREQGTPWNKISKQNNDSQDNFWTSND